MPIASRLVRPLRAVSPSSPRMRDSFALNNRPHHFPCMVSGSVAHPSSETPYSALTMAKLAKRAGIPVGVFNVGTGLAPTIVEPWTKDSRVRALSFTGSTQVGKLLYHGN